MSDLDKTIRDAVVTTHGIARELRVSGVSSPDAPAPRPEQRDWRSGDRAAWRGREVTVMGEADQVCIELPNGDLAHVDADELDVLSEPTPGGES